MNGSTRALHDAARSILATMEPDVSLVPESLAQWWSSYLEYHTDRYLKSLDFLEQRESRVLEIGSVPAQFTLLLQRLGYQVRGMDLAPERIDGFLRKHDLHVDKVNIEIDRFPFEDRSFGLAIFMEVLEHLRINPLHTFREIARVLEPGGRMVLSTPNITPMHRLMFLLGKDYQGDIVDEFKKLERVGHMGHIRLYSVPEIYSFCREVGLEPVSHSFHGEYMGTTLKTKLVQWALLNKATCRTYAYVVARKPV